MTGVGTLISGSPGLYFAQQVTVGQSTYVASLSVGCFENSTTGESAYVALYDNNSGNLLASATFSAKLSDGLSVKTVPITPLTLPAGAYNLVILVPTATTQMGLERSTNTKVEYGSYSGGAPPSDYYVLALTDYTGGFFTQAGEALYFTGCP